MSSQNIVIVGGGAAGVSIAVSLAAQLPKVGTGYRVVLVTAREVYVHLLAMLRLSVNRAAKVEETALIPYDAILPSNVGTVKIGAVSSIVPRSSNGGEVVLENGETIPYRYLVVATGSLWGGPLSEVTGSKSQLLESARQWQDKFKSAKSILIVGGGSVGLELAGEIRDVYSDKRITIVQADHLPLNDTYPTSFRKNVQKNWEKRNVMFATSDRVDVNSITRDGQDRVITAKNRAIAADLIVPTTGGRPNTRLFSDLSPSLVDENGRVLVQPTLQVVGHSNIFAAGDITNVKEQKQLMKAQAHAEVVVANIISLIKGQTALKEYKTKMEGIFVTNGKKGGSGVLNILWKPTFGNRMVAMMKSKDLFVGGQRKLMGYT